MLDSAEVGLAQRRHWYPKGNVNSQFYLTAGARVSDVLENGVDIQALKICLLAIATQSSPKGRFSPKNEFVLTDGKKHGDALPATRQFHWGAALCVVN
jgi:hypothetical protein